MRLAEIVGKPELAVQFTKQFVKDYAEFAKAWPDLKRTFAEFLETKREDWNAPFGQKDKPSSGRFFKGWRHCHLVYGKAILSYDISPEWVRCARITDHLSLEGNGQKIRSLDAYLTKLSDDDFATVQTQVSKEVGPDRVMIAAARALFYEMAAHREDRKLLHAFASGQSDDALEFLAVAEPPVEPERVGGANALRKLATEVLRAVPMNESDGSEPDEYPWSDPRDRGCRTRRARGRFRENGAEGRI